MQIGRWKCALCAAILLLPCSAGAAPWPQPEGHGFAITTVNVTEAKINAGTPNPAFGKGDYRQYIVSSYIEYGLTSRITLGAIPEFEFVRFKTGSAALTTSGFGDVELFARTVVWQQAEWWGAAQANLKLPTGYDPHANPALGNGQIDFEPRLSIGRGFMIGDWSSFGYLDLGYRVRFAGPNDQLRVNIGLGMRPAVRWTVFIQSFNIINTVQPPHGINFSIGNLAGTAVYDLSSRWSVQLGIFSQIATANFNPGSGVSTGVWWRF